MEIEWLEWVLKMHTSALNSTDGLFITTVDSTIQKDVYNL